MKIENNEIEYLSLKWILEYCKNAGSNKYRKIMREKKKLETYIKTTQQEFYDDIKNYIGINDDNEFEPEEKSRYQKALRAFSLLDGKCQEIIKLKFVENLNHKEILVKIKSINTERSSIATLNRCINRWKKLIDKMND